MVVYFFVVYVWWFFVIGKVAASGETGETITEDVGASSSATEI